MQPNCIYNNAPYLQGVIILGPVKVNNTFDTAGMSRDKLKPFKPGALML